MPDNQMPNTQNVFFYLAGAVEDFSIENTKTITTNNDTLQLWTVTTEALNEAWLKGNPGEVNDLDTLIQAIQDDIKTGNKKKLGDDLNTLKSVYFKASEKEKYWNAGDISTLMGALASAPDDLIDKDTKTNLLTIIQQQGTLIQATMTQQGSIGDTEGKAQGNVSSGLSSAAQTTVQIGDAGNGVMPKVANALSQLA
jgi:hypothetical protein